jgi:plastocyanin
MSGTLLASLSGWIDNHSMRLRQQLEKDTAQGSSKKIKNKETDKMTKRNVRIVGVVMPIMIAMLLLFAGSSRVTASDQPSAANVAVKIDNFVFGPQAITVPVGTTVTWTNSDDIPHTAVSTDGVFKSKVMDTDEKFSYTFTKAGTYSYYCSVHPKMTGQIVVK